MNKILLSIFLLSVQVGFAQMPIGTVRTQPVTTSVTLRGRVLNGSELGSIRYVQDATGGIAAYSAPSTNLLASVLRGDSIEVTGTLVDFNTLLEINPISNFTVISSGNAPAPQIITPLLMDENHEGELVRINNVTFANAGQTFGTGTSTFTAGTESGIIYVSGTSLLNGQQIPSGAVDIVGIVSAYQGVYQLLLRDVNDLINNGNGILINSPVTITNIANNGFFLNWTTDIAGTTGVKYGLTPQLELGSLSYTSTSINHSYQFNNLLPGNIYYCAAFSVLGNDTSFSSIKPYGTKSLSTGNIKVYFNDSVNNAVSTGQNAIQLYHAIDDTLIAYIDRAEKTLDLTIYDFDNTAISNISTAINAAKTRGVKVRFISDGNQAATNFGVNQLATNIPKITSPTTSAYNIMHNKFVVIDAKHTNPNKPIVWSGSTNWTDRQINRDPNSVVIIQDQTLAKAYTLEFEEMWGDTSATPNLTTSKFGSFKTDNTPHEFNINNKRVECYFSPSDGTNNYLLSTIASADNNIYFASMIITRADIASALSAENAQGTTIKGLVNVVATTGGQWSALYNFMGAANLRSNQDSANTIMHHKYMIVDENQLTNDPLIWVGSHNWTAAANNKNDENTMVIHDASITNMYFQEFIERFTENGGLLLDVKNNAPSTCKSFPTVLNNLSELNYYINTNANLNIAVFNNNGALVYTENANNKTSGFYTLNASTNLTKGIYIVQFNADGKLFTNKVVIE